MSLRDGLAKGYPLCAGRDGVAGVFDVGTRDVGARVGEQDRADVEVAVRAVGGCFGLDHLFAEGVEFYGGEVVLFAGLLDGEGVGARGYCWLC